MIKIMIMIMIMIIIINTVIIIMGLTNPSQEAASKYIASANISGPLAQQIKSQVHMPPDETEIHAE